MAGLELLAIFRNDRLSEFQDHVKDSDSFLQPIGLNSNFLDPILQNGASMLACAVFWKAFKCVNYMIGNIQMGIDTTFDTCGRSLLHFAAASNLQMYQIISEHCPNTNVVDSDGETVVHYAARYGNVDLLKYLWANGTNLDVASRSGDTAVHSAIIGLSFEATEFLLNAGCPPGQASNNGCLPLMLLQYRAITTKKILQLFIARGVNLDEPIPGPAGPTLLWFYYHKGDVRIVDLLLQAGADPFIRNAQGWTLSEVAAQDRKLEIFQILQRHTRK